jgi:hypothetical protein
MAKEPQLSALDRIRQLDEERKRIMEEAKGEALARANEAVDALNALGFNYRLASGGEGGGTGRRATSEGGRKGTRQVNPNRPCPICGFRTEPPHDARRHRGQDPKRPFSEEELQANHMRRVG